MGRADLSVMSVSSVIQEPGRAAQPRQPAGTWVQRAYDGLRPRRPSRHDLEWLGSGNLAVRRDLLERAQGFDERLVTYEDVDLCRHLRSMGVRLARAFALATRSSHRTRRTDVAAE